MLSSRRAGIRCALLAPLCIMIGFLIGGCSSADSPLSLAGLPRIPNVSHYEGAQEVIYDQLTTALRLALDEPSIEIAYFYDSSDREWEEIVESFSAVLTSGKWTLAAQTSSGAIARWTRRCRGGSQTLVLATISLSSDGRIFALVLGGG